ncbi:MAG: helix-turn-helix transcriptional regulator [Ruminococcaceae bacterium]|nr:helix-turn-helix transcriptional regulator [Oscillospiraceae bacterium]
MRVDGENSIIVRKDYGKIHFCFKEVMAQKGINRNQLAKRAGFRFEVADRFYQGKLERIDVDVLARVCYVLGCSIADVMKYER